MLPTDEDLKLHILISNDTRELCRVAMPLTSLVNLEHMFPDADLQRVKESGVDFARVIARALESDYAPQTLIETRTAERSYKLWIG